MMRKAISLISTAFKAADLKFDAQDAGPFSFTDMGLTGENCTFRLRFISEEENDVKAMTDDFAKFPPNKMQKGYQLMNELNRTYKFFKFAMDEKGAVCAQYDFPISVKEEEIGAIAVEIVIRCMGIVDDAYPKIMQAIWS